MTDLDSSDQLLEDAATWFARMRGPEANEHRAAFEAWLARGALHRSAYNRAAEIFAMGKILTLEDLPASASVAAPQRKRMSAVATLCAAAVLCCLVLLIYPGSPLRLQDRPDTLAAVTATRVEAPADRIRVSRLEDGSRVRLEPGSVIETRIGDTERHVALARGAIRVEVSAGDLPFRVSAGGGTIIARGTVFDVALSRASRVTVRLLKGLVEVELPRQSGRQGGSTARRLTAGETLSFAAHQAGSAPSRQPPSADRRGAVRAFDDVPLSQLIRYVNATGAARPIRLAEPRLGRRLVSGRFRIDDTERLAAQLGALFALEVDRSDPSVFLLRER